MKKIRDDFGKTVDGEDDLTRMILIEQAIDSAFEISDVISRSYAFCDCVIAIVEFARERNDQDVLELADSLFENIENIGALIRARCYFAVTLATFGSVERAELILEEMLVRSSLIKDDFDQRDAILEIATAFGDLGHIANKSALVDKAIALSGALTYSQQAYLFGYLSSISIDEIEVLLLMRKAITIADIIKDPIARAKVFIELSNLLTGINEPLE